MVYHSKKDWWLVSVVWAGILFLLLIGIYNLIAPGGNASLGWEFLFSCAVTVAIVLLMTYPLYYEITASELIVRCGVLVRKEIPLSLIVEARSTRNPASAPAWSLDRVQIDYQRDGSPRSVIISPKDKLKFMRELAGSGTTLELRDERVVRI